MTLRRLSGADVEAPKDGSFSRLERSIHTPKIKSVAPKGSEMTLMGLPAHTGADVESPKDGSFSQLGRTTHTRKIKSVAPKGSEMTLMVLRRTPVQT